MRTVEAEAVCPIPVLISSKETFIERSVLGVPNHC